jgi:hypothetical protein
MTASLQNFPDHSPEIHRDDGPSARSSVVSIYCGG